MDGDAGAAAAVTGVAVVDARVIATLLLLRVRLASWLASLGLLHLSGGQLHVGIPHHLTVQLLLGPQQHPHTDRQLALGRLGVLSLQNGCIQLTSNLTTMIVTQ